MRWNREKSQGAWRVFTDALSWAANGLTLTGKAAVGIPVALLALAGAARLLTMVACLLVLTAGGFSVWTARYRHDGSKGRARALGHARLFGFTGVLLIALALLTNQLAFTLVTAALIGGLVTVAVADGMRQARQARRDELAEAQAACACPLAAFLPVATVAPLVAALLIAGSVSLALAVSGDTGPAAGSAPEGSAPDKSKPEGPESEGPAPHPLPPSRREDKTVPTYAEDCPDLEDPQAIGHGLGALFEHDGAIKAGCGSEATEVPGLGVWVSAGTCDGELRSFAVSSPGRDPVILYGDAATAAWESAQAGDLLGAEAAEPGAGDLDLIKTRDGTEAYVRPSRVLLPGNKNPRNCRDVGGEARGFVHLSPPVIYLWRELLNSRTKWTWPSVVQASTEATAFVDHRSGEVVGTASCDPAGCSMEVEEKVWTAPLGAAFYELKELTTFAP